LLVTFPDVPEAITFRCRHEDEALMYAVDALEVRALSFYVDDRKPLPVPSKPKRGQRRYVPRAGMRQAGRLPGDDGTGHPQVRVGPPPGLAHAAGGSAVRSAHASRLDQIEAAARALGRHIEVSVT
jgi:antitoxin HicB